MNEFEKETEVFGPNEDQIYTAGINHTYNRFGNEKCWGNRIECYGSSAAEAEGLRDNIFAALSDAERYRFLRQRLTGEEFERITNRWPMSNEEADAAVDETIAKLQGEK